MKYLLLLLLLFISVISFGQGSKPTPMGTSQNMLEVKGGIRCDSFLGVPIVDITKPIFPYDSRKIGDFVMNKNDSLLYYYDGTVFKKVTTGAGTGSVTSVTGVEDHGFKFIIFNPTTTPQITALLSNNSLSSGDVLMAGAIGGLLGIVRAVDGTNFIGLATLPSVDSFNAVGNGSTVDYTATVASGYNNVMAWIATPQTSLTGAEFAIVRSAYIIGITLHVNVIGFDATTSLPIPITGTYKIKYQLKKQ